MGKQLSSFTRLKSVKPALKKLTTKKSQGNNAEKLACTFLQDKGLILLEKNFATKAGEVDLVMIDKQASENETLVFIEVRYRKNADFGGAAASVTEKKQQRIIKAALAYQQQNSPQSSMRFDVVAIEGDNVSNNPEINWIADAFSGF